MKFAWPVLLALTLSFSACGDELPGTAEGDVERPEFRLADGIEVGDLSGVSEGYAVEVVPEGYTVFTINVSAERLAAGFRVLAEQVSGPGFFVLEIGTRRDVMHRSLNCPEPG